MELDQEPTDRPERSSAVQLRIVARTRWELYKVAKVLEAGCGGSIAVNGPFENKYEPGYHAYVVVFGGWAR